MNADVKYGIGRSEEGARGSIRFKFRMKQQSEDHKSEDCYTY